MVVTVNLGVDKSAEKKSERFFKEPGSRQIQEVIEIVEQKLENSSKNIMG